MGHAAEAILEGWFCKYCGDLMVGDDEEPAGYPGSCQACGECEDE